MDRLHIKTLALLPLSYVSSFRYSIRVLRTTPNPVLSFNKKYTEMGVVDLVPKTLIIRVLRTTPNPVLSFNKKGTRDQTGGRQHTRSTGQPGVRAGLYTTSLSQTLHLRPRR